MAAGHCARTDESYALVVQVDDRTHVSGTAKTGFAQ